MQLSEKQELVRLLGLYQSELLMENEENLRKKMRSNESSKKVVTDYSYGVKAQPEIEKVGYGSARHPKYTITVESFNELIPISSARDYKLLQIPLGDGRFELVSTSMVEIQYY